MSEKIKSYRDLLVWQKGMSLTKHIYLLTEGFPDTERFGLTSQLRRCAVSIPSNVAEGWGRGQNKYFGNHLKIARGSLCELETQLTLAVELNFINEISAEVEAMISELGKMLTSLINKVDGRTD
ncbi:MAG: four helix bundle protein [Bacteroidetes bacterium]|nr:MAG: four helix bundle protein [Bacteroidota bacterium]